MERAVGRVRGAAKRIPVVRRAEGRFPGGVFVVRAVELVFDFAEELVDAGGLGLRGLVG